MIRDLLVAAVQHALDACGFPAPPAGVELTPPKDSTHGDFTTNVALQITKAVGLPPREVAAKLAEELERERPASLERVEIAGPGFLNLYLSPVWLHDVLRAVVAQGERYGHGRALAGERINLEFVSANPTGPLHAGGARWVAVGDALANVLAAQGAEVHREYYLNDAGNQLDTFARSLMARYRGEEPPEDGYHGQYLVEMAARMRTELGDAVDEDTAREWGYGVVVQSLKDDLARIGVNVTLRTIPYAVWLRKYSANDWAGDMFSLTWDSSSFYDVIRVIGNASCAKPSPFFCDPALTPVIAAVDTEMDEAKRLTALKALIARYAAIAPALFLVTVSHHYGYAPKIKTMTLRNSGVVYEGVAFAP